jgi:hypothetical protein
MIQVFDALRTGWMHHQVTRNMQMAKRYETLFREHQFTVEGDIALRLMMKYKDRADNLIRQMK